eukprot:sb/3465774/
MFCRLSLTPYKSIKDGDGISVPYEDSTTGNRNHLSMRKYRLVSNWPSGCVAVAVCLSGTWKVTKISTIPLTRESVSWTMESGWRAAGIIDALKSARSDSVDVKVTCATSGRGKILIGDDQGNLHFLSQDMSVETKELYNAQITHVAVIPKGKQNLVVTVGEDQRAHPLLRVWNVEPNKPMEPIRTVDLTTLNKNSNELVVVSCDIFCQEPTESSKQSIRTRYLGHMTGYQPIREHYFLIRSVPAFYYNTPNTHNPPCLARPSFCVLHPRTVSVCVPIFILKANIGRPPIIGYVMCLSLFLPLSLIVSVLQDGQGAQRERRGARGGNGKYHPELEKNIYINIYIFFQFGYVPTIKPSPETLKVNLRTSYRLVP